MKTPIVLPAVHCIAQAYLWGWLCKSAKLCVVVPTQVFNTSLSKEGRLCMSVVAPACERTENIWGQFWGVSKNIDATSVGGLRAEVLPGCVWPACWQGTKPTKQHQLVLFFWACCFVARPSSAALGPCEAAPVWSWHQAPVEAVTSQISPIIFGPTS